jgi:integrase
MIRSAAGLAPRRPHDLRHTGVAFLAAAGVDPSEIARRVGQTSVEFTYVRYGHLLPEVDKQAATKLEALRSFADVDGRETVMRIDGAATSR